MITTRQLISKYGKPNITGAGYLETIKLPYPMRISWETKSKVTKMSCHKLVKDKFLSVFNDLNKRVMAKRIGSEVKTFDKKHVARPGVHAKTKTSKTKTSKNYKKPYAKQGR